MNDAEFRAIVAAGPSVVMVASAHMLALLDERDKLVAGMDRLRGALQKIAGISNQCTWTPKLRPLAAELQDIIRAALAPTRTDGGDA